jgi:hypothetical protein
MATTVMNTFALCASFAEQVGAVGAELPFCCHWMNKITKNYEKSKKIPFKIASKWHVDVDFLMRRYPYLLRDVLEKVASSKPRVLNGQDNQIVTR